MYYPFPEGSALLQQNVTEQIDCFLSFINIHSGMVNHASNIFPFRPSRSSYNDSYLKDSLYLVNGIGNY